MNNSIDKVIKIKCKGAETVPIESLHEFQGDLKELRKEEYDKFQKEILHHGFIEPISVWVDQGKYWILNGHQRKRVLMGFKADGYLVPNIPVSIIHADSFQEAKEIVLSLISQYGRVTEETLYEYAHLNNIKLEMLDNLRLPEVDLERWKKAHFEPPFDPPTEEDPKPPKVITCPECEHEFYPYA